MLNELVGLIGLVVAILVIYDVLANQKKFSTAQKIVWVVLAILFSIITGIVYYLMYKK